MNEQLSMKVIADAMELIWEDAWEEDKARLHQQVKEMKKKEQQKTLPGWQELPKPRTNNSLHKTDLKTLLGEESDY